MLEFKVGDYIQNNDDPDIILQILEIDDSSSSTKITPFSHKCVAAVMRRYSASTRYNPTPVSFDFGGEYWIYTNEVKLNYKLLPNFRVIAEFNEDLKELIND